MSVRKGNIRFRIHQVLFLLMLAMAGGIYYVLKNMSLSLIYQQISSLVIVIVLWGGLLFLIYYLLSRNIYRPVKKIEEVLETLAAGDISQKVDYHSNDELGRVSEHIDHIIQNQTVQAEFLEKIGDGNFNIDYSLISEKDKLGYSISNMRDKLHKLVSEDARRQWSAEGIARFSALLRENIDDIKHLSDVLLKGLVKYLQANQGMIFMLNDDTPGKVYLEMTAAFAWDRKKYISKTIEIGEGLIGQAVLEKGTVFLTDVPDNYISITSGLGDANPRCILIVPFIFNEEIFGVMEFASFKVYEPYEIEFAEKLAEIIASTLSRAKTNQQTEKLLRESQKLTEELRTQEEEMRQNLEEMNATQEEMQHREVERIGIFTAINNTIATVEFTMDGRIITANEKFLNMMNFTLEEIENKTDRIFADKSNEPIEIYNKFWNELKQGILKSDDFKRITKDGREIWLSASYTPALDKHGKPYKVIELAQDITEKKKAEFEAQRQAEELRTQGEKLKAYTAELEDIKQNLSEKLNEASKGLIKKLQDIEFEKAKNTAILEGSVDGVICFNQEGIIEYFNHSSEEIWGLQRESVLGKPIGSIMPVVLATKENNLTAYYTNNGENHEIAVRTEISFPDNNGNSIDILATLTKAKVENEITFTIFAQKISVDLF